MPHRHRLPVFAPGAFLLIGLTTGCGAGLFGIGASVGSDDPAANEEAAPEVSLRNPRPNATELDTDVIVVLGFTQPIDPNFDPSSLITLTTLGEEADGVATIVGSQIEVRPDAPLALDQVYRVRAVGRVEFESGSGLNVDEEWMFRTRDGEWGGAELVLTFSSVINAESSPSGRVAASSSGELVVQGSGSPISSLFVATTNDEGDWGPPLALPSEPGQGDIFTPRLSWSQDESRLVAAWLTDSFGSSNRAIRTATLAADDGAEWETRSPIPNLDGSQVRDFALVHTPDGRAHCVVASSAIVVSSLDASGNWTPPALLADNGTSHSILGSAQDTEGRPVVAWFSSNDSVIRYVQADDVGNWSPVREVVGVAPQDFYRLGSITPDDEGGMAVLYAHYIDSLNPFYEIVHIDSAGMETARTIVDQSGQIGYKFIEADLAYVGDGRFVGVYRGDVSSGPSDIVFGFEWTPSTGGPVTNVTSLTLPGVEQGSERFLVMSGRPNFGAVAYWSSTRYFLNDPDISRIEAVRYQPGQGWGDVQLLSDGLYGCPTVPVNVEMSRRGTVTAVWTEVSDCDISGKSGTPSNALYSLSSHFE